MQKNFFVRYPKTTLLLLNSFFIGVIFFILNLDVLQDVKGGEKYSVIDRADYQLRCRGKRNIMLRENSPNQNAFRIPPYDKSQKYRFRTDENGFVEPSKIHEKADVNIFFLGGSTTECEIVDELNRFPYLVGRILEKKTEKKINSYNAGKSGNNSLHSINNLINKIVPLDPNIIVRMDNVNDLSTLLYEATYWNRNKGRSNLECFNKNPNSNRSLKNEWEESPFRDMILDANHQAKIRQEHYKILKLFIMVVRGVGATPVLMTQANRIENNPDFDMGRGSKEFNKAYRQLYIDFHNITRHIAQEEKVMLIDLANEVPGSEKYIYDSVHVNNEGSRLEAEIISQHLEKIVQNYKK